MSVKNSIGIRHTETKYTDPPNSVDKDFQFTWIKIFIKDTGANNKI
jgi:hypothetical protein